MKVKNNLEKGNPIYIIFLGIILSSIFPLSVHCIGRMKWSFAIGINTKVVVDEVLLCFVGLVIIFLCNYQKKILTLNKNILDSLLTAGAYVCFVSFLFCLQSYNKVLCRKNGIDYKMLLYSFIFCFLVGFAEELFYRGFLLNFFLERLHHNRRELNIAILINGFIFGLSHFTNIIICSNRDFIRGIQIDMPLFV